MSERAWWDAFAATWLLIALHHAADVHTGRGHTDNLLSALRRFQRQKETLRQVARAGRKRNRRLEAMSYMAKVVVDE